MVDGPRLENGPPSGPRARAGERACFGPFELDVARRLLLRDARPVRIGSRAMDILIALLRRPGETISARDLVAQAWPRAIAAGANLRAQVLKLRRALGDGEEMRFIENVPARGYRFTCHVEWRSGVGVRETAEPAGSGPMLPVPRILGREAIVADILARMPRRRLLTLVGPGGVGKTSVAHALAAAFAPACADGVRWIDLAALNGEGSAAEAIAVAVGLVSFTNDHSPSVISWLRDKRLLLVMDCADRMVEDVARLAEKIVSEAPGVHVFVTSREALRAGGEHVIRLPPLAVPPDRPDMRAADALTFSAVQLFVERAAAVLGGFNLRDEDVPYVTRICARLDGIALAIELAAGHLVGLELRDLAALLEGKFGLLPIGRRTALTRHQTMRMVLQWSYDTLSPRERDLLLGLSIFEGETGMVAIRAVAPDAELSTEELAEGLGRLVDKSLVSAKITAAGLTYQLLDTTRSFALERLRETGRLQAVSRRHAKFVLETLRGIEANHEGLRAGDWFDARRRELPNMRAALNWACEFNAGDPLQWELSALAARVLLDLSLVEQCRRRVSQALVSMERCATVDLALEMRLKIMQAIASFYTPGPTRETVETLEQVLAISERLSDNEYRAVALWGLWSVSVFRDEPARALVYAEQFRSTQTELSPVARSLLLDRMSGIALHMLGDQCAARDCLERVSNSFDPAMHSWHSLGLHVDHGLMARIYLARVLWLQGESVSALQTCQDSVEALQSQGHAIAQCHALFEVAIPLNYMSGDIEAAKANLVLLHDLAMRYGLATFEAGATLASLAFAAIEEKTNLSACRVAAQALRACRYDALYPWLCAILAEEALRRGDTDAGREWISSSLVNDNGAISGWWLAELLRLRGEIAAAGSNPEARQRALEDLQRAVDTARQQGALMLELRATVSRVSVDRGHRAPAELKSELDSVLRRFKEGAAAADLISARRLCAELAA